jgi:hypothetical protein
MSKPTITDLELDNNGELPAYAWPGGYAIYYLDRDNSVVCPSCANKQRKIDIESPGYIPQFNIVAWGINYDEPDEADFFCDECSKQII